MATHKVKLTKREEIAVGTMAFYFEKPAGFQFKAGQFLEVTLIDPPETDAEGNSRTFSIASAPFEPDLMVATRMRDTAFKRVLKALPIGTEVSMEGPYGTFILHNDATSPAGFLMGGIGITPVRSILLDATQRKLSHRLFLFYSNRRPEDAAFLEDLQQLEKENPNYRFIGIMTGIEKSRQVWSGETEHINREMLAKYVGDLTVPIFYIAGPPAMVKAMKATLNNAGVTNDKIRAEEFAGY
ncbi:MAG: FAD-dependent oxidoreductase [Deltaproteobacteria bacterium]|nr:FAD-dependent oxidoreductase [Deltaproteobacteria bacterium]